MVFNLATARQYAHEGRVEQWLHAYLNVPEWANTTLSAIIRHQKPLWIGPIEVELSQLVRACGPEAGMPFPEEPLIWEKSIATILSSLSEPSALPPLIVRPVQGTFDIPDGNHRHEAMLRKGWRTGWVWLWCDREPRFSGIWSTTD